ncbi:MAG: hypothetical protein FP825_06845 [Hyphomonas sp.]|uniref:hypothetical protein n=1 Tax=Hyphomonas sp. TaxID=87 RepID=UPI0018332CEB|nr:hypothetical protein [Hyphomonas sp.]MBA3068178.1 hypothetical protein [Hyphomonas sp.]MBU3919840.1 hypothetical protein [Alphaproteobacteria bacterium]MBU4062100.1 hypothetical protein [Alphaproteobacteria bacterium]MBU4165534.1 hypothetical protein [Alphaproteobacteria bacterium]
MTNEPDRIRTEAAARAVGLSREAFYALAALRGWLAQRDEQDGRYFTYDRASVEQEAKIRAARNARVTPADLKHAVRCAAIIRTYWERRGHTVDVEAVGTEIISDTCNGLPARK